MCIAILVLVKLTTLQKEKLSTVVIFLLLLKKVHLIKLTIALQAQIYLKIENESKLNFFNILTVRTCRRKSF